MAKKTNSNYDVIPAFSAQDREAYANSVAIINDAQLQADGLAERIAAELFRVRERKLYMLEEAGSYGEKDFTKWATDTFTMSKGSVSDAVNTFARFRDTDSIQIAEKWQNYTFSALMRMKGLTDAQIERANISPTMSRRQVLEAIDSLKVLEIEDARKSDLNDKLDKASERFQKVSGKNFKAAADVIKELIPNYADHLKNGTRTIEEMEQALAILNNMVEFWENGDRVKSAEQYNIAIAAEEDSQEKEEAIQEQEEDAHEQEEEQHTYPVKTINVSEIVSEYLARGLKDDELDASIAAKLAGIISQEWKDVINGVNDILFTV